MNEKWNIAKDFNFKSQEKRRNCPLKLLKNPAI